MLTNLGKKFAHDDRGGGWTKDWTVEHLITLTTFITTIIIIIIIIT